MKMEDMVSSFRDGRYERFLHTDKVNFKKNVQILCTTCLLDYIYNIPRRFSYHPSDGGSNIRLALHK